MGDIFGPKEVTVLAGKWRKREGWIEASLFVNGRTDCIF
jgi:hypothetical protein